MGLRGLATATICACALAAAAPTASRGQEACPELQQPEGIAAAQGLPGYTIPPDSILDLVLPSTSLLAFLPSRTFDGRIRPGVPRQGMLLYRDDTMETPERLLRRRLAHELSHNQYWLLSEERRDAVDAAFLDAFGRDALIAYVPPAVHQTYARIVEIAGDRAGDRLIVGETLADLQMLDDFPVPSHLRSELDRLDDPFVRTRYRSPRTFLPFEQAYLQMRRNGVSLTCGIRSVLTDVGITGNRHRAEMLLERMRDGPLTVIW